MLRIENRVTTYSTQISNEKKNNVCSQHTIFVAEQARQQVPESICRNLTVHLTVQDEWDLSSTTLAVAPTYLQTVDIFLTSSQSLEPTTILYGH